MPLSQQIAGMFSPPATSVIALEIDISVRIILVSLNDKPSITAFSVFPLPDHITGDTLASLLIDFTKTHAVTTRDVVICAALKPFYIKRLKLPLLPDNELAQAAQWRLKEEINCDIAQSVFAHQVIKKNSKIDGTSTEDVLSVVTGAAQVQDVAEGLKKQGFNCLAVSATPFGYAALLERYPAVAEEGLRCLFHMKWNMSFFAMYEKGQLLFYREIPIAISQFQAALTGTFATSSGHIELSKEEIEDIIFSHGICRDEYMYKGKVSSVQLSGMMYPVVERLSQEIKRSLEYYASEFGGSAVKTMYFLGEGARIPHLQEALGKEISLPVSSWNLSSVVSLAPGMEEGMIPVLAAIFGLAIGYYKTVNMLPGEYRQGNIEKLEWKSFRWAAFIAVAVLGLLFAILQADVSGHRKKLDALQSNMNILAQVRATNMHLAALTAFCQEVSGQDRDVGGLLKKISKLVPGDIFFEDFDFDIQGKQGMLKGYVRRANNSSEALLSSLVTGLNGLVVIRDATILSVEKSVRNAAEVDSFRISFRIP